MYKVIGLIVLLLVCGNMLSAGQKDVATANSINLSKTHKTDSLQPEKRDTLQKLPELKFPSPFTPFLLLGQPYQPSRN
jgi:hypothetical protein